MSVPACAVLVVPQRRPKRCLLPAAKDEEHANKDDDDVKTAHDNFETGLYTTKTGLSRRGFPYSQDDRRRGRRSPLP